MYTKELLEDKINNISKELNNLEEKKKNRKALKRLTVLKQSKLKYLKMLYPCLYERINSL